MARRRTHGRLLSDAPPPEFSRPFAVAELGDRPIAVDLAAERAERMALADRFGLEAVDALTASLELTALGGDMVRVRGRYRAEVIQTCVVTLEPVPARLEETFEALFAPESAIGPVGHEVVVVPEHDDPPEPIEDGFIDLGEAVAQQLGLALDPYPRAPGAVLPPTDAAAGPEGGPFAVLGRLKDAGGKDGRD